MRPCIQPSLVGLEIRYLGHPNTEVLGYYRPSLREAEWGEWARLAFGNYFLGVLGDAPFCIAFRWKKWRGFGFSVNLVGVIAPLSKPEVICTHESDLDGFVSGLLLQRLGEKLF